jgi:hypothetical protein
MSGQVAEHGLRRREAIKHLAAPSQSAAWSLIRSLTNPSNSIDRSPNRVSNLASVSASSQVAPLPTLSGISSIACRRRGDSSLSEFTPAISRPSRIKPICANNLSPELGHQQQPEN